MESTKKIHHTDMCNTLDESITTILDIYKNTMTQHVTSDELDDYFTVLSTLKNLHRDMKCHKLS